MDGDLIRVDSIKLAYLKLLLRLHVLRSGRVLIWSSHCHWEWRPIELVCISLTTHFWFIPSFDKVFCLAVFYALMKGRSILFNIGFFAELARPRLAVTMVWWVVVCDRDVGFLIMLVIVDNGGRLNGILRISWFLFEIVLFMYVLDDFLVLAFYIFDLFLQILELQMQGFYLLVAPDVTSISYGLCDCWVGRGIKLWTDSSIFFFHYNLKINIRSILISLCLFFKENIDHILIEKVLPSVLNTQTLDWIMLNCLTFLSIRHFQNGLYLFYPFVFLLYLLVQTIKSLCHFIANHLFLNRLFVLFLLLPSLHREFLRSLPKFYQFL